MHASERFRIRSLIGVMTVAAVLPLVPARNLAADFHHVHLNATNPAEAAKWYAENLGGVPRKIGFFSAVGFGKTVIIFFQAKPGFAESKGSSVDHIGFSYKDIDAKMKELAEKKVEIVSGVEQEGPIKYAFVKDPWGTLVEIVEDPQIQGFHHVHLAVTDPEAALAWYTSAFGGEAGKFAGLIPGIRYGDMWVLAKKVREPAAPTKGRAIDHISWSFANLDEAAVELKAKKVHFESEPFTFGTSRIAFVVDPVGVRIELVGPAKTK
jgi:catechol 2,3-dioxygenase-like lactoylglutathione lyase family enzyme